MEKGSGAPLFRMVWLGVIEGTSKYSVREELREDFSSARPAGAKQNSARVVSPTRKNFVTNDGKNSVDSSCDEFLEVPYTNPFSNTSVGRNPRAS